MIVISKEKEIICVLDTYSYLDEEEITTTMALVVTSKKGESDTDEDIRLRYKGVDYYPEGDGGLPVYGGQLNPPGTDEEEGCTPEEYIKLLDKRFPGADFQPSQELETMFTRTGIPLVNVIRFQDFLDLDHPEETRRNRKVFRLKKRDRYKNTYRSKDGRYLLTELGAYELPDYGIPEYPIIGKIIGRVLMRHDFAEYPQLMVDDRRYVPIKGGWEVFDVFLNPKETGGGYIEAPTWEEFWDKTRELIPGVEWVRSPGLAKALKKPKIYGGTPSVCTPD